MESGIIKLRSNYRFDYLRGEELGSEFEIRGNKEASLYPLPSPPPSCVTTTLDIPAPRFPRDTLFPPSRMRCDLFLPSSLFHAAKLRMLWHSLESTGAASVRHLPIHVKTRSPPGTFDLAPVRLSARRGGNLSPCRVSLSLDLRDVWSL
mgnify:CR=1 FL=1